MTIPSQMDIIVVTQLTDTGLEELQMIIIIKKLYFILRSRITGCKLV